MIMDRKVLEDIYNQLKVPYKYGAVLKIDGRKVDSPVVFKKDAKYYMTFVSIDNDCKTGYKTHVAESENLVEWHVLGDILTQKGVWDSAQTAGYAEFQDIAFGGSNELLKVDGKYFFGYLGGNLSGYETDPLSTGLAIADDFLDFESYEKLPNPVLSGSDKDARRGETLTIFKPCMFIDDRKILGHRFVNVYNARGEERRESIFLAVSDDGLSWKRYGDKAILSVFDYEENIRILGDPQIVKIDEYYVMLYFVWDRNVGAYNTFAVSKDLTSWTVWGGEPLVKSEYSWENVFAHKQWVIKENGVVYHYYCAVNDKERFIAVATSKAIK